MTQIKEGLIKSQAYTHVAMNTDDSIQSTDKKPSPELFEMIQAAASSLTGFAQLWESIRKKGTSEGFSDRELQGLLRPLLQNKLGMNKDQVYYLFHREEQIKRVQDNHNRKFTEIVEKKEPEQSDIEKIGEYRRAEEKRESEEEEPTELELAEIRIKHLEEALKKTEQFKPATTFDSAGEPIYEGQVIDWLKKRANGISSFYYDAYGIDLFKNRELSQLKNSGVKVFRRLYFEV